LLPAVQAAREAARRAQCANNIKQVALAVLNYENHNKIFPEGMTFEPGDGGGKLELLSQFGPNWIIKILPDLENQGIYDAFDKTVVAGKIKWTRINQPGAGNKNVEARGSVIAELLCPSDPNNGTKYSGHGGNWARGNYAASAGRAYIYNYAGPLDTVEQQNLARANSHMAGPLTKAWSGTAWSAGDNLYCRRGVMGPNAGVTLSQISDGASKTIMIGEIRAGLLPEDPRGVWALGHAGASLLARYGGGGDANGPNACYSNSDDVPVPSHLADTPGICLPSTNSVTAAECMTAHAAGFDQAAVRSKHPGGAHVALCDGSVQFINDDIETTGCGLFGCCSVWDWMITSADNAYGGSFNGLSRGNICQ
jgi:prepilin-type processing-associated H-X9-DG protein